MRTAFVLAVLLSTGCVGKKKYNLLLADYTDSQSALRECQDDVTDLTNRLETSQERYKALTAEHARAVQNEDELQSSVQDMQKALVELSQRKADADARINEFRNLISRFKALIDAGKLRVKIQDGRMVVELATDILFDSGSASLSAQGKVAISEVALVLANIPDRRFQVEGHTDDIPMHSSQYPSNWELAAARSVTVVKTLVDGGLPPNRVSAASYAEFKPVVPNDSPINRASNRRIEIVVMPDLSTLPGFEELKNLNTNP